MNFKSHAFDLTDDEFADAYRNLKCRANDRETDLNMPCADFILKNLDKQSASLLDVGCGRGYWLNRVADEAEFILTGCDLYDNVPLKNGVYIKADVEKLPFDDNSFDIVTCQHTIEHVRNPQKAVSELKRVAKNQLIIVTPCQRFFNYTLDLHINFYPVESYLTSLIGMKNYTCKKIFGDWVYMCSMNNQ